MKKRILIIFSVIIVTVLTTFGCINDDKKVKSATKNQTVSVDIDQRTGKATFYGNDFLMKNFSKNLPSLFYSVRGKYNNTITLDQLQKANSISDLIPNYPSSWIAAYISVEIIATIDGEKLKTESKNTTLNKVQKELFNSSNRVENIAIKTKYKSKNSVTEKLENNEMNYAMTVVPTTEAEYIGGYNKMISYLENNSSKKILELGFSKLDFVSISISFSVNKKGIIENMELLESSESEKIDSLLVNLIQTMPKWKPAKNSKNDAVREDFMFNVGNGGC